MTPPAGLLLTGGRSRRFGSDKAGITVNGRTLGARSAEVLSAVCAPVLEVGPAVTVLSAVREEPPGGGPLAAVAAGWGELQRSGWTGATIVMAIDLPLVSRDFLRWLAAYPATGSAATVVPYVDDRAQPLCARYSADAMTTAARLVAEGRRAMRDLLDVIAITRVVSQDWRAVAAADVVTDIDTPDDLARIFPSGR